MIRQILSRSSSVLGWVLISNPYEVMPVGDVRCHVSGTDCWCHPHYDEDGMISHNSLDRREDYEMRRRKPH